MKEAFQCVGWGRKKAVFILPDPFFFFPCATTGTDTLTLLMRHPDIPHLVGVLDGDRGQFTIFAYTPENSMFWVRANPGHTPDFPGGH
jgi:hypothetical protein